MPIFSNSITLLLQTKRFQPIRNKPHPNTHCSKMNKTSQKQQKIQNPSKKNAASKKRPATRHTTKRSIATAPKKTQNSFQKTTKLISSTPLVVSPITLPTPVPLNSIKKSRFSTVQVPEVFVGEEDADDGEARLPFSVTDAIKIKEALIDGIKGSDSIKESLSHLGTAHINSMLKQTQIENLVGQATLEVIQQLARAGEISLPDIGSGTIAAQNFNTLYSLLQLQDNTGKLKELSDEQWCIIMEMTFGTDQVVTRNVSISDKAAIKIATDYRNAVSTKKFKDEISERMMEQPLPPGGNPIQLKLAHELRQMEISNIVAPILEGIYGKYQFDGHEGFCLMKKAMEQHISNGDVVSILNEAQRHIIEASGLDQHVILEN